MRNLILSLIAITINSGCAFVFDPVCNDNNCQQDSGIDAGTTTNIYRSYPTEELDASTDQGSSIYLDATVDVNSYLKEIPVPTLIPAPSPIPNPPDPTNK